MNRCIFVGNLTRDPEVNTTSGGATYCRFTIAVNRPYSNANGDREADFINIVAWRNLAERCGKYLSKGSKVGVVGSLQIRSYDDKDGNRRTTYDIVADDVEFIGPRQTQEGDFSAPADKPSRKPVVEMKQVESEDLPF